MPHDEERIDRTTLHRLAAAWPTRAVVRGDLAVLDHDAEFDATVPDYPLSVVPFADHPGFAAATPAQRDQVLTGLWLGYNERVIAAEQLLVEPAFDLIARGVFPGSDDPLVRQAIQQSLVDESFHTYMHMMAISRTRDLRGVTTRPAMPTMVTRRRLDRRLAELPEAWQRDLAVLVWGAVSETAISTLLALIARDRTIQPMHSLIATLHLRDESAHGAIVVEVVKLLYRRMNPAQQRMLAELLPLALHAFTEQDMSALRVELAHANVRGAERILDDLRASTPSGRPKLVRDYSGTRRIVRELGLTDQIDFTFPEPPAELTGHADEFA